MSEKRIGVLTGIVIVSVLGLVLAFSLSVRTVNAQAEQVTLEPTDDTFVVSTIPDSYYGEYDYVQIMNFVNGTFPNKATCLTLTWLKFNLSTVPNGAVIDTATLQLYTLFASETFNVHAYSCSSNSWTESSLTYSNMPSYNTTSMDSAIVAAGDQWYNWSVLDAVGNALNSNSTSPTIVLSDPSLHNSASVTVFRSREVYSTDLHPKLIVHWSSVMPEFPTFLVLSSFMIATLVAVASYKKKILPAKGSSQAERRI